MQLALMNRRVLVIVQELDGILDRHDMVGVRLIYKIDDRRRALNSCRFPWDQLPRQCRS
jgi:hypothetical protein